MFDLKISTLDDIQALKENQQLECKSALGKDAQGALPKDFWPTYSSFANAHGGIIALGVSETKDGFKLEGIRETKKIIDDLFNQLNNPQKVSCNLLTEQDIAVHTIESKQIITIRIPQASRKQKPVFINRTPLGNTYKRLGEGDRVCDDETVKRMLAEQIEDERDNRILTGFTMDDIELTSLQAYRLMLRDSKPSHPFLAHNDFEFFQKIRGWRKDRQTNEEGITLAGLLMFGKWEAIQEGAPHYFVDYQERAEPKTSARWSYRLTPDGRWSGNLFDFFQKIYRRLIADLDIPFALKGGQRIDEDTPAHIALREALVNTLVHADYSGRVSVLVVKRPDMFGFRNPGSMRIPLDRAQVGGESDCRNRILHQMFLMIGLGERAGSGIPKIYSEWKNCNWRPPKLHEVDNPESTLLQLHRVDLLPKSALNDLKALYGDRFDALDENDRIILTTAFAEGTVSHPRVAEIVPNIHPRDISSKLRALSNNGFLKAHGKTRGVVYQLIGVKHLSPDDVFGSAPFYLGYRYLASNTEHLASSSEHSPSSSEHLTLSSEYLTPSSEHLPLSSKQRDSEGRLLSEKLDVPIVDNLGTLSQEFKTKLSEIAKEPRTKGKLSRDKMTEAILHMCHNQYVTLPILAELLHRSPDGLRTQYLSGLIKNRKIALAFPSTPTHPKQAYKSLERQNK